jgi:hypothetical protein
MVLLLTACGSSGSDSSSDTTTTTSSPPTTTIAPTTTTPPGPRHAVWTVVTSAGAVVRVGDLTTGSFHTASTLPGDAVVIAAGAAWVMYTSAGHLHGLDLTAASDTDYGGGDGFIFFGGAFSPDGTRFAYVRATDVNEASLRVITLASGSVVSIGSFPDNRYDVPKVWTDTTMASVDVLGFSDAGVLGAATLDPATGVRTSHTDVSGSAIVIAADASHAANTVHTSLGDEGDVTPPSLGPPQPFNTLQAFVIGAVPSNALQAAHHQMRVLALTRDGSRLLFSDDAAAGGFAGISISPDFGLMVWNGTAKTQIAKFGSRWDSAAFVDTTTFVAAAHDGATESLMRWNGSAMTTLDRLAGDGPVVVAVY